MAVLIEGVEQGVVQGGVLAGQGGAETLESSHQQREHTGTWGPHLGERGLEKMEERGDKRREGGGRRRKKVAGRSRGRG